MSIYKAYQNAIGRHREALWFRTYGIRDIPQKSLCRPLDDTQKEQVRQLWGSIWYRENYRWHEFYQGLTGTFDARFVPTEVFNARMLPVLNDRNLRMAWEDKAGYDRLFADLPRARTLGACMHGSLYAEDGKPVGLEDLHARLQAFPEVLVKPSLDTYCGKGVEFFQPELIAPQQLQDMLVARSGNCVIQLPIRQHQLLATLNESSCNPMRVNTLRLDGAYHVLNATVRFGDTGNRTDVTLDAQGNEYLNLLGIDAQGRTMDLVYDARGNTTPAQEHGIAPGTPLPGYQQACDICLQAHQRLPHFDLVAFDTAIDENGNALIIEANMGTVGVNNYQYMHGPFFGELTERVIHKVAAAQ